MVVGNGKVQGGRIYASDFFLNKEWGHKDPKKPIGKVLLCGAPTTHWYFTRGASDTDKRRPY